MWASIGSAIWVFISPYILPILSAFAGETWRKQYEAILRLEAENAQKQAALDLLKSNSVPVAGAAARLRASKWNRKQQP